MSGNQRAEVAVVVAVVTGLATAVAFLLAALRLTGVEPIPWGWVVGGPALGAVGVVGAFAAAVLAARGVDRALARWHR